MPPERLSSAAEILAKFPFALHPISVFEITDQRNVFADLVGPLTPTHHLQAQSKIVELGQRTAEPLLRLDRKEVPPALPRSELGWGRILQKLRQLAPKHTGTFTGQFGDHEIWYVYALILSDRTGRPHAVKVGYSNVPEARLAAHNGPIAPEVTGFMWKLGFKQPTSSEDTAREVEQRLLKQFEDRRLPSNGEMLANVDPLIVMAEIAKILRSMRHRENRQL